jgi:nitrogen regulatory protein PII
MTLHAAEKVVIITEKIICDGVCKIIKECGATGYTIFEAGGQGSRNVRTTAQRAMLVDEFANVQIEIIVNNYVMAEAIMDKVKNTYFGNYSGITYLEDIKILRPEKFQNKL